MQRLYSAAAGWGARVPYGLAGMRIRTDHGLFVDPGDRVRVDECGDLHGESRNFFAAKSATFLLGKRLHAGQKRTLLWVNEKAASGNIAVAPGVIW